jgi:hypothetical protein
MAKICSPASGLLKCRFSADFYDGTMLVSNDCGHEAELRLQSPVPFGILTLEVGQ